MFKLGRYPPQNIQLSHLQVFISRTIVRWWGTTRLTPGLSWSTGATKATTQRQSKLEQNYQLQYPSADKQVIAAFVLLSFFLLHEIDQVLKGRLINGTRRAQNEKLITSALLRLGALKWNYSLQSGNLWVHYESEIVWMLNPDIYIHIFFSVDVTRSSPVLYH